MGSKSTTDSIPLGPERWNIWKELDGSCTKKGAFVSNLQLLEQQYQLVAFRLILTIGLAYVREILSEYTLSIL